MGEGMRFFLFLNETCVENTVKLRNFGTGSPESGLIRGMLLILNIE